MRASTRLLALLFSLALACTSGEAPASSRPQPAPETPEPVAPRPPADPPAPRAVTFTASDGITISGELRAAADPSAPLVILVHQLSSTHEEWQPLADRLVALGIATFAYDVRGHGESVRGADGQEISWRDFETDDWQRTGADVLAALAWARSDASGVAPSSIAVVGSSIGSTAVVDAASREPAIAAIAALSPGRAYRGYDALTPAMELAGRPFFTAVSAEEQDSVETARAMARITSSEAVVVPGAAHGVALFSADPDVLDQLVAFLARSLGVEPA